MAGAGRPARIRAALAEHPESGELTSFLPPIPTEQRPLKMRAAVASTFVAGLELAKVGVVQATQGHTFEAVQLRAALAEEG